MNIMDKNYGLFVVNLYTDDRDLINESYMGKFDTIDDFIPGLNRIKSDLRVFTLEEFFNRLNDDNIDTDASYTQIIQLKK